MQQFYAQDGIHHNIHYTYIEDKKYDIEDIKDKKNRYIFIVGKNDKFLA